MRVSSIVWMWVVALLLVGLAWQWGPDWSLGDPKVDVEGLVDPSVGNIAAVTSITIERDGDTWQFEREDDGWWQVAPFRHRMHADLLLNPVAAAFETQVFDVADERVAVEPARLGLAPPLATLTMATADHETSLHLGRRGMAGRAWAMRDEDGAVFVVDGSLHDAVLLEHPATWRDLRFYPDLSVDATRLERTVQGESMILERSGRDWNIMAPISTRADAAVVAEQLVALASASGEAVLMDQPDDPAAFGLDPAVARIAVTTVNGTRTLLVGDVIAGSDQARYAMVEGAPVVVRMGPRDVQRLLGDPMSLVERSGTAVTPMDVHQITILVDDQPLVLTRSLDRWVATSRDGAVASSESVDQLLGLLTQSLATELLMVKQYPSDLEEAVITLADRNGGPIDTVRLLREPPPPAGLGRWAMENGDGVLRVLPEGTQWPLSPEAFGLPSDSTR